ncbi:MAG: type II toxin-antitoxin system VapC family toxin [Chloroflexota bacterium]|nr:type II toxin-antitoxin system VapC family toxin [Chloroflexota bacterium]
MSGFVVVDASVAVKWLVREEHTDRALAILSTWHDDEITPSAPYLLPLEVANALHRRVIRNQLNVGDAARMILQLLSSRLELHQTQALHVRALELATELQQGAVYDAHYLALAEEFGCELWTADKRFCRAASQSGRNVRWIGEPGILG